MNKIGVITEKNKDNVLVMVGNSANCGNCGCSALTRKNGELCDDDHKYIKVKNTINAEIGDPVNIEFKTSKMLKTSAMLYLVPMIMLVVGIFAGNAIQGENANDVLTFGIGILFLAVSFFVLSKIDKSKNKEELITISFFKGV